MSRVGTGRRLHPRPLLAGALALTIWSGPAAAAPAAQVNLLGPNGLLGLLVPGPPPPPPPPPPLVSPSLPLTAPAVMVPLLLRLPSLGVAARVLAVGDNAQGQMDAPQGAANDPVWQEVFWYRASASPLAGGGTATLAGHVDDSLARPAVFAQLRRLSPGDAVQVVDLRNGRTVNYRVGETELYTLAEANSPAVRERIFGSGGSAGPPQLALITCAGDWQGTTFNHRFVAYAQRSDPAPQAARGYTR